MKVVTFGEIMLRLSTPGYQRFVQSASFDASFGGGEANVAVSLAGYGIQVDYVSRIPANDIGDACVANLRKHNVGIGHILRGGSRLGIYFLETGVVNRASKVVYDRAHSSMAEIEPGMINWHKVFEGASWFHWTGITPAISAGAAAVCQEAITIARKCGLTVSTDLNYRKNLWQYGQSAKDIMEPLVSGCDIILGNEEDAEKVFGIVPVNTDIVRGNVQGAAYESVCRQLMSRFPQSKKVIITLRGSVNASHNTWSGVLFDGTTLYSAPVYQVTHIVDRVGSGDSFMAGIIYGLTQFAGNDQRALNFAVAASCLKHTIPGDFNLVSANEVLTLMAGDGSGRVVR